MKVKFRKAKYFYFVAFFGEYATNLEMMVPFGMVIFSREIPGQKFVITVFLKYLKLEVNEIINSQRNQDL